MEYREEEKPEQKTSEEQKADANGVAKTQQIADSIAQTAGSNELYYVTTPGHVNLTQLQAETPFAEWQVDIAASASNANQQFRKMPTAWQLSQAGTVNAAKASKGPSMVTFFVAIVACVVVTGALFSGRE